MNEDQNVQTTELTEAENNSKFEDNTSKKLSDDEIYSSVQTEKLIQRKKTKRIATLVGLCTAFALALIVIILATVPVSFKPRCLNLNNLQDVTLYGTAKSSTLEVEEETDEKALNNFKKCLDQSFSQTCLFALFNGSIGNYNIDERTYYSLPVDNVESTLKGENYAGKDNNLVRLRFKEPQVLTNQNGSKYDSERGPRYLWDLQLKFTELYVVVNKDAGIKDTKIFVVASYPVFEENQQTGTANHIVGVTVKADTNKLYSSWSDFMV